MADAGVVEEDVEVGESGAECGDGGGGSEVGFMQGDVGEVAEVGEAVEGACGGDDVEVAVVEIAGEEVADGVGGAAGYEDGLLGWHDGRCLVGDDMGDVVKKGRISAEWKTTVASRVARSA